MAQYWCPNCHQFYGDAGYCPFDGARLSIPPEAISQSARAVSAHDGDAAVLELLRTDNNQQAIYERLVGQTLDGRYLIERRPSRAPSNSTTPMPRNGVSPSICTCAKCCASAPWRS